MKKIIMLLLASMLVMQSASVFAEESDATETIKTYNYSEIAQEITGIQPLPDKINIYFFHGDGCPPCSSEMVWLTQMEEKYPNKLNIIYIETWKNEDNKAKFQEFVEAVGEEITYVPQTIIGNKKIMGYNKELSEQIENKIATMSIELTIRNFKARFKPLFSQGSTNSLFRGFGSLTRPFSQTILPLPPQPENE